MIPFSPILSHLVTPNDSSASNGTEPNAELIRPTGWMVKSVHGEYCVAWRGSEEIVLRWQDGGWVVVAGRGEFQTAG
ncbi:MAG TPA: hypothetical protein VGJ05_19040 [Fimbriiglobus sp.]|jgi:hypothetical protein